MAASRARAARSLPTSWNGTATRRTAWTRRRSPVSETELTPAEAQATAIGEYRYGFHDEVTSVFRTRRGLDEDVVREISAHKSEPEWMTEFRVKSYRHFVDRPLPEWGADLSVIDFENIYYYLKPVSEQAKSWDELPPGMRETWDKLGI